MDAVPARNQKPSPAPGSRAEQAAFKRLQDRLPKMYREVFPDDGAPRSVVILPSLSLDQEVMARVTGVSHYEERLLCLLLLLRLPRTRVIYLSSQPIPETVIDYHLNLLPGVPGHHARQRLTLLACHDGAPRSLTEKLLARPRLIQRIREAIPDPAAAHLTCFNVTELERSLAVRLGIPIYGCDPDLLHLGSKSGSRSLFREAGVPLPEGVEDLADEKDLGEGLAALKAKLPDLRHAVIKLNDGFSGEGNAVFSFDGAPEGPGLKTWIGERLDAMTFGAKDMTWETYRAKMLDMGVVAEAFVDGRTKRSPSVQFRVDPSGKLDALSTHDQVLGGGADQVFLGCRFPADESYRLEIQAEGLKAARRLRDQGVVGRFGIDFISLREAGRWRHHAIEVNLRKGGTTHPYIMLQYLTDGAYDPDSGLYRTPAGRPCYYYASDNIENERYRGLTPDDLIDIAVLNNLHFHGAAQEGVVFHLIGALSEFGKLGVVCVADSPLSAQRLYDETIAVLDRETA